MAILVLALGIGANVAMFTFVDVMLFKPSPWSHDGRLVWLTSFHWPLLRERKHVRIQIT